MNKRRKQWLVVVPSAAYVVAAVVACMLMTDYPDRWWPATVLAYVPRWPLLLPAVTLASVAVYGKQWAWVAVNGATACLVLSVYMGLALPFPRTQPGSPTEGTEIRVATYNINAVAIETSWLKPLLAATRADVIALQECGDQDLASDVIPGYEAKCVSTQCLLSRFPIAAVDPRDRTDAYQRSGNGAIVRFELDVHGRAVQVILVHLETVREGLEALRYRRFAGVPELEANIELRRWESQIARAWSERGEGARLVLGDFNMPVESAIYRNSWGHLTNAFDECGMGYGHTKQTRWHGVRIDHVLMDGGWTCTDVSLGDPNGSDHVPLIATLRLR